MIFRKKIPKALQDNEPLQHDDHDRPVTRREFIARGLMTGAATVSLASGLSLFANPRDAMGAVSLSQDLAALKSACGIKSLGAGKIPFICFDLAGGANIAGSNVLVGQQGGQMDFLSTAGYSKQGLPGDMIPPVLNPNGNTRDFIDTSLGLAFHSDSALLRGIIEKASTRTANINGAVIPARSNNDTGNNPHNPMYAIARAGSDGSLLTLIGSRNSDSGGNSVAPAAMINPGIRPTKVDRPSDVTGLVDTGKLIGIFNQADAVAVMESMARISMAKLGAVNTGLTNDAVIKDLVKCGYIKAADIAARFGVPSDLDPVKDPNIVGATGIFTQTEFNNDREFQKTASVMKMVMNGFAGAGTVTLGGYDYHTGDRATGERRDLRAGRCIGACLEYAARLSVPVMIYVFSDGSVASNGMVDNSTDGRGKGVWTADNSSTAASFFLVYDPSARPALFSGDALPPEQHQQLGHFRADGSVETASSPAANNVNLLVETVVLNYLALHGEQNRFSQLFPNHGLGNAALIDRMTAFDPVGSVANGVLI